jgi:uncharacterized protein (DUF1786 family)
MIVHACSVLPQAQYCANEVRVWAKTEPTSYLSRVTMGGGHRSNVVGRHKLQGKLLEEGNDLQAFTLTCARVFV